MKLSGWIVIAALAASAGPAAASSTWIGVNGGVGLPLGDFADLADTGFQIGGSAEVEVSPMWSVGGEIGFMSFGGDSDVEDVLSFFYGESVDVSFRLIPITAIARLNFPTESNVQPFLRGGVGAYMGTSKIDGQSFSDDESSTDIGFNLGGGMTVASSGNVRFGGDVIYHYIATEDTATNLFTLRFLVLFGAGGP